MINKKTKLALILVLSLSILGGTLVSAKSAVDEDKTISATEIALKAAVQVSISIKESKSIGWEEKFNKGSGYFITENVVVTNAHVVEQMDAEVNLYDYEGKHYKAKVINLERDKDIALLRVDEVKHSYLQIADGIKVGQTAITVGNPGDEVKDYSFTVFEGIVSQLTNTMTDPVSKKSVEVIQFQLPCYPGNSGGPVVNLDGKLIGMATAVPKDKPGITFGVKITDIKKFLEDNT